MTSFAAVRRILAAALAPAPLEDAGGLPWEAIYPATPPPAIAPPATAPARIRFVTTPSSGPAILALANPARVSLTIVNTSTGSIYVRLGRGATTAAGGYSVIAPAGGSVQLEGPDVYRGDVTAAWAIADGGAELTEL